MLKVTFFGNCQLRTISNIIALICDNVETRYLSNNARTGNLKSVNDIYDVLKKSDVIVLQNLGLDHGKLSSESVRNELSSKCYITLPYVFNSGITIVGYAPMSAKFSYGEIFGHDEMLSILNMDMSAQSIIAAIESGNDLGSRSRFEDCINELRRREANADVSIGDFLLENYKR